MAHLSAIQAFVLGFCSSGYDFAIASSRPHLTMRTLQVAIGFAGNCAPCGLSPQTNGMPVIPKRHGLPQTIPILSFSVYDATQDCLHNMIFVHVVLYSGFPATRRPAVVHVFHRPFSLRFPVSGSAARAGFPYRIEEYSSVFFSLRQQNPALSYIFIHFLNSRLFDF